METVELRSDAPFPEDVQLVEEKSTKPLVTRKISAYDFSHPVGFTSSGSFNFGIHPQRTAEILRQIADRIDSKQLLPQRAQVTSESDRADYTRSVLIFEFCEKNSETL